MWKTYVEPDRPQITIWRMPIACWILRLKTHTQNFHDNNGFANAPQCYFIHTLLDLCKSYLTHSNFMKLYPIQYNIIQSYYFSCFCFYFRYVHEALYLKPANYRGGAFLAYKVSTDSSLYRKFLLDCIISVIVGLYPQQTMPLFTFISSRRIHCIYSLFRSPRYVFYMGMLGALDFSLLFQCSRQRCCSVFIH